MAKVKDFGIGFALALLVLVFNVFVFNVFVSTHVAMTSLSPFSIFVQILIFVLPLSLLLFPLVFRRGAISLGAFLVFFIIFGLIAMGDYRAAKSFHRQVVERGQ